MKIQNKNGKRKDFILTNNVIVIAHVNVANFTYVLRENKIDTCLDINTEFLFPMVMFFASQNMWCVHKHPHKGGKRRTYA